MINLSRDAKGPAFKWELTTRKELRGFSFASGFWLSSVTRPQNSSGVSRAQAALDEQAHLDHLPPRILPQISSSA